MYILLGLVVLALTTYFATVSAALRAYSASRLQEYLRVSAGDPRLNWLARKELELILITGLVRTLAKFALLLTVVGVWFHGQNQPVALLDLLYPGLAALALFLIFGVGIPHAIAQNAAERVLGGSLGLLSVLDRLFWPFSRLLVGIEQLMRGLLGRSATIPADVSIRVEQEILDAVSAGELHGAVKEGQKEIIESVFELDATQVSAIMTPRTEVIAIGVDVSLDEARRAVIESGHSRIPVYEESLDHVIGVLYAKDLLTCHDAAEFSLRKLMRRASYVPKTKSLGKLLHELRTSRVQLAIVLDEYGGTAGIVTLEDVLEELVGEIDDEYDAPEDRTDTIRHIGEDTLEVDGRVRIADLNEHLGIQLPEDAAYDTISGFIQHQLGHLPRSGEELEYENLRVRIIEADPRRISQVHVRIMPPVAAPQ